MAPFWSVASLLRTRASSVPSGSVTLSSVELMNSARLIVTSSRDCVSRYTQYRRPIPCSSLIPRKREKADSLPDRCRSSSMLTRTLTPLPWLLLSAAPLTAAAPRARHAPLSCAWPPRSGLFAKPLRPPQAGDMKDHQGEDFLVLYPYDRHRSVFFCVSQVLTSRKCRVR